MEDFDEARTARALGDEERRFKLGGEVFTIRSAARPETLIAASRITNASSIEEDVPSLDEIIHALLEDEGRDRYAALRAREDDPVTYDDLLAVATWAVRVSTGRPTERPSASSPGPGQTGTPLTAVAPLPVETSTG